MADVDSRARRDRMGEEWLRRPALKLASWQPIEATNYHVTQTRYLSLADLAIAIPEADSEHRLILRGGTATKSTALPHP